MLWIEENEGRRVSTFEMGMVEPLEREWDLAWHPARLVAMVHMGESWKVWVSSLHSNSHFSRTQELNLQDHHRWLKLETWAPSWHPPPHPSRPIGTMSTRPMECLLNLSLPTISTFLSSPCVVSHLVHCKSHPTRFMTAALCSRLPSTLWPRGLPQCLSQHPLF